MSDGHLRKNLELLRRRWPRAAERVEAAPLLPVGAVVSGRSGEPTLILEAEDGRSVAFHSRHDPRGEAQAQLETLELSAGDTVVALGAGLGYALEALSTDSRTGFLIVVERDPRILRAMLDRTDFEALLTRPEAEFLVGGGPEELFELLSQRLSRFFAGPVKLLVHPPSLRAAPSHYEGFSRAIGDFSRHGAVLLRSALYLSRVSLENRLKNLPQYVESPGVRRLLGRFTGYPGVVVSAGPSLEKNIHHLERLQGRAIVIAVSTALKILLGRGIRPDFTVVIDYHPVSARYFEGVAAAGAPPLIADVKASPQAVDAYAGAKLFAADPLLDLLVEGAAGDKGFIHGGSTVAHCAFDALRRFGCDPIVFVGQDLSYPEGKLHATGSASTLQQLHETNRHYTLEMKEWEYYLLHRKTLSKVPGALGGEVWTCDVFLTYLREFEKMFRESEARVIDCTEGGALKEGAEVMPLQDALARFATRDLSPEVRALLDPTRDSPEELAARRERVVRVLERRIEEGEELRSHYRAAIRHLEGVIQLNERGSPADELAARVIALKEEFTKHDLLYYLLNQVAQSDLFIRQKRDRDLELGDLKGVPRQKAQAERDLEYVRGLRGALEFLLERLRGAVLALRRQERAVASATKRR